MLPVLDEVAGSMRSGLASSGTAGTFTMGTGDVIGGEGIGRDWGEYQHISTHSPCTHAAHPQSVHCG